MSPLTQFHNTVGARSLEGSERQALLDRLEKNGTPLEEVNKITTGTTLEEPIEIKPDARTPEQRKFDAANPVPNDPSAYHLNLASVVPANAPMVAVQELEQHAGQFAIAVGLTQPAAADLMRDVMRYSNEQAGMSAEQRDAWQAREVVIMTRAMGGPEKLEAALVPVRELLAKADPGFIAHMAPALNSSAVAMQLIHHAQLLAWREGKRQ
jgi:hypothetical protein